MNDNDYNEIIEIERKAQEILSHGLVEVLPGGNEYRVTYRDEVNIVSLEALTCDCELFARFNSCAHFHAVEEYSNYGEGG